MCVCEQDLSLDNPQGLICYKTLMHAHRVFLSLAFSIDLRIKLNFFPVILLISKFHNHL